MDTLPLRDKLNLETARIDWPALQPFFARGQLLWVSPGLDLIDVGVALAEDRTDTVQAWLEQGLARAPQDEDARHWEREGTDFWALVVAPFVLVQPIAAGRP